MADRMKDTEAWVNSQCPADKADWQESLEADCHDALTADWQEYLSADWQDSDSADTELIPDLDEYYANRVGKFFSTLLSIQCVKTDAGDLAGGRPVSCFPLTFPGDMLTPT